jgi:hypothetical protein
MSRKHSSERFDGKPLRQWNKSLAGSGYSLVQTTFGVSVYSEGGDYLFRRKTLATAITEIRRLIDLDAKSYAEDEARRTAAKRLPHYAEYADLPEISPGVFVAAGSGVYIVDDDGEVVCWTADEAAEDGYAFTAAVNAVALATKHGAAAVRENIDGRGIRLDAMILETGSLTS